MRKVKFIELVARALIASLSLIAVLSQGTMIAQATEVSFPEELTEDWFDQPDVSDEEMNQAVDEYLKSIGVDNADVSDIESSLIEDPKLRLEQADKGRLKYILPNGASFVVNVPSGMITTETVTFEFTGSMMMMAGKDDENPRLVDEPYFKEPGVYSLTMIFYQSPSAGSNAYNVYEVDYRFTIIKERDGSLGVITAPDGFRISEARKDGVPMEVIRSETVFLEEDAVYEIRYQDLRTGEIHLKTTFERDTEAPFLTFSKELTDGETEGPLEYYPSEQNCTVMMTYEGNRGSAVTNVLTAGGLYQLEVSDEVGNTRIYHVVIRQTYELIDTRLIILALLLLGAMMIRMIIARRDMRVI